MLPRSALMLFLALAGCRANDEPSEDSGVDTEANTDNNNDTDNDGYTDDVDCDDNDASVNPGAAEICDDIDNDCDRAVDNDPVDASQWYRDSDGDGFGDANDWQESCSQPNGYIADMDDCNDADAAIYPNAPERCNNADSDCDSDVDEDAIDASQWYRDFDEDGFGDVLDGQMACAQPSGYVGDGTDCDDDDITIHPDASNIPGNGIDEDCTASGPSISPCQDGPSDLGSWYGAVPSLFVSSSLPGGSANLLPTVDDAPSEHNDVISTNIDVSHAIITNIEAFTTSPDIVWMQDSEGAARTFGVAMPGVAIGNTVSFTATQVKNWHGEPEIIQADNFVITGSIGSVFVWESQGRAMDYPSEGRMNVHVWGELIASQGSCGDNITCYDLQYGTERVDIRLDDDTATVGDCVEFVGPLSVWNEDERLDASINPEWVRAFVP